MGRSGIFAGYLPRGSSAIPLDYYPTIIPTASGLI